LWKSFANFFDLHNDEIALIHNPDSVISTRDGGFCRPGAEKSLLGLNTKRFPKFLVSLWQFRHGLAVFSGIGSAVVHSCGEVALDGLAAAHDA
jgi:hypothetical protein